MKVKGRVAGMVLVGAMAACGSDDDTSGAVTTDAVGTVDGAIEVTYDGEGCTSDVREAVPAGVHDFVFANTSDQIMVELYVRRLEEGHTYEEVVELQSVAGGPGAYFARPSWSLSVPMPSPPERLADDRVQYTHDVQPGSFAVVVGTSTQIWLCGGFDAVEG